MTAAALTAAQAGLVSCETCRLLSRPADAGRAGLLPALRRGARVAPPPLHPVHVGARHRGGDLLHPGQRAAGAHHDHARVRRFRHHHGRRGVSLHLGIVAARAHRAGRERDDPARQAGRARLSADHRAARLDREQPRAHAALSHGRVHRPLVDARRVRRHVHRRARAAAAADVGGARPGRAVLRGGGGADDARGGVLRPPSDLGFAARAWRAAMAESTDRDNLPQATVVPRKRTRISVVWIIPILAAVVAIGIAVQRILSEGPTITIVFKAAEGIEAGKTFIKYKDVNIGQVTAVQLSDDYTKVEVTAKIAKNAAGLMVEDAKFWVVEPRITPERGLRPRHAALGQLHRLRGRQVDQDSSASSSGSTCRRSSPAAAGPAVRAQGRRPGLAGDRLADLLPPPAGRPGRRLRPGGRRQGGRRQGLRQRALRQVRQPAARASGTRAESTSRSARTAWTCARSRWSRCSRAASRSTRRPSPPGPSPPPRTRSSRSTATGPPR